jgi:hypothetical protein
LLRAKIAKSTVPPLSVVINLNVFEDSLAYQSRYSKPHLLDYKAEEDLLFMAHFGAISI